jgi:hypothetical protein
MTKQSAMVTAGALVLALLTGVAAHDLTRSPQLPGTQIVIQISPGVSTTVGVPSAPPAQGEGR